MSSAAEEHQSSLLLPPPVCTVCLLDATGIFSLTGGRGEGEAGTDYGIHKHRSVPEGLIKKPHKWSQGASVNRKRKRRFLEKLLSL